MSGNDGLTGRDGYRGHLETARLPATRRLSRRLAAPGRNAFMAACTAAVVFVIPAKYGFDLSAILTTAAGWVESAIAAVFALDLVIRFVRSRRRGEFISEHRGEITLFVLLAAALVLFPLAMKESSAESIASILVAVELYLALNVLLRIISFERFLLSLDVKPIQIFVLSFAAIILLGTAALALLPNATTDHKGLGFLDALFTATSATCVTGLAVVDTGTRFTPFGQVILMILMELGGLGIMTFATFFAVALGSRMSMGESFVIKDSLNVEALGTVKKFLVSIFASTIAVEAAGAALIYATGAGASHPAGNLRFSVFHSVSAFCNAGFSLNSDGLIPYRAMPGFNFVIMGLIVAGGLGFAVMNEIFRLRIVPLFRIVLFRRRKAQRMKRLSGHARLVLYTSALLTVFGTGVFLLTESGGPFASMGADERTLSALFMSVTSRTAGFNTIDIGALTSAGLVTVMFLMFVGASPGSTGGGIKTSTFAVLCLSIWSIFRGREDIEVFKRRIPREILGKALAIVFCSMLLVFTATLLLAFIEPTRSLRAVLFEVVSAFATVGLSTGITADLSVAGRLVIIGVMFIGRLGPMTVVLALAAREKRTPYSYAEETVMIG